MQLPFNAASLNDQFLATSFPDALRLVGVSSHPLEPGKQGRTDFDPEIKQDKIAASLSEEFFCYQRDGLKLAFGPYVFGTYADGSYAVDVPYSVLKPILASDGPLGSLR